MLNIACLKEGVLLWLARECWRVRARLTRIVIIFIIIIIIVIIIRS